MSNKFPTKQASVAELKQFHIDENTPAIVPDMLQFLEYIYQHEPEVGKTNHFLSTKHLQAINQRMTKPLQLDLQRPVQKSFPHINGLYLLARTALLVDVDLAGKKPRLIINPDAVTTWQQLTPVEQYFNLLEIWLLYANLETIDEGHSWNAIQGAENFYIMLGRLSKDLRKNRYGHIDLKESFYLPGLYTLGLMELFGFVQIKHLPPETGQGWCIESVQLHPAALAIAAILVPKGLKGFYLEEYRFNPLLDMIGKQLPKQLGKLQPLLQAAVPQWKNNFTPPQLPGFATGHVVIKARILKWRCMLRVPPDALWSDVASAILAAVGFDEDHLYRFTYRDRVGVEQYIDMDEPPYSDETTVGEIGLLPKQKLIFHYDFGDDWRFELAVESMHADTVDLIEIFEVKGTAPQQYPDWDEDDPD